MRFPAAKRSDIEAVPWGSPFDPLLAADRGQKKKTRSGGAVAGSKLQDLSVFVDRLHAPLSRDVAATTTRGEGERSRTHADEFIRGARKTEARVTKGSESGPKDRVRGAWRSHSARMAVNGSTRTARSAGKAPPAAVIASDKATAASHVGASAGPTPARSACIARPAAQASDAPSTTPAGSRPSRRHPRGRRRGLLLRAAGAPSDRVFAACRPPHPSRFAALRNDETARFPAPDVISRRLETLRCDGPPA